MADLESQLKNQPSVRTKGQGDLHFATSTKIAIGGILSSQRNLILRREVSGSVKLLVYFVELVRAIGHRILIAFLPKGQLSCFGVQFSMANLICTSIS